MSYVRYRHGRFHVRVSPPPTNDVLDAVPGEALLELRAGDRHDGFMEEPEMLLLASRCIDFADYERLEDSSLQPGPASLAAPGSLAPRRG